jgi:hypothetical protein
MSWGMPFSHGSPEVSAWPRLHNSWAVEHALPLLCLRDRQLLDLIPFVGSGTVKQVLLYCSYPSCLSGKQTLNGLIDY